MDDVLNDISAEDAAEYARLRATYPSFDPVPTERAVSAATAALLGEIEEIPEALELQLRADANTHFARHSTVVEMPAATVSKSVREPRASWPLWGGWLAAAASLLLAVGVWLHDGQQETTTPAQARAALLGSGREVVQLSWSAGGDATGAQASGDVVWDPQRQMGYMRFAGLARNDPTQEQYQLWIFDAQRDERYPVDGGVFDVDEKGEVVIPIRASLPVADAQLFAVTVEKAGGVVVSDRSRIAVLAKRG